MEEIVNRIRALCRSKNTSITKIEEELHFANGTIGKWKNGKRTPPLEKVILIAERLGTTPEYILRGEQKEKPALQMENGFDSDTKELFDIWNSEDESGRKALIELARFLKSKREK